MRKRMLAGLLSVCFIWCAVPALAEDTPVFSTIVYLTDEDAAPQLARYQGIAEADALEKLRAAGRAAAEAGAVEGRFKPAYVYGHVDVGEGNLIELGALTEAARMPGEKLVFTGVTACYSRPVNRMLRWTPTGTVTGTIEGGAAVRVTAKGLATVPAEDARTAAALKDRGFTAVFSEGRTVYQKAAELSVRLPILEEPRIGEGDVSTAYLEMIRLFQAQSGMTADRYPRMALDLRTPVGLNESAKTMLLEQLSKEGFTQVSEMDMDTYHAAETQDGRNVLADCYLYIDRVQAAGNTVRFSVGGYAGQTACFLRDCVIEKGPDGWTVTETGEQKIS